MLLKARLVLWVQLTLAILAPAAASADNWLFVPRLSLEETYTDNVLLAKRGGEGDFVTAITPGMSVRGDSARLHANIDYNLQQLLYGDKTELDGINHQMQANTATAIVKNWLFFDIDSAMSQQNTDNRGQIARTNRNGNTNRRDVTSYEWAPRVTHKFGTLFDFDGRYYQQQVSTSRNSPAVSSFSGGDSSETGYEVEFRGGQRFGRFPLAAQSSSRTVEFRDGNRQVFSSNTGEASYIFNSRFRFTASGGVENNAFTSRTSTNSGAIWNIGGTWTPSPRTTVSGKWGDRFFGKNFNVSAEHRARHLTFSLKYIEDIRTQNQFQRDLVLVPLVDAGGLPVFDPVTSGQIFSPLDGPSFSDDVFLEKNLSLGVNYTLGRSDLGLRFFDVDRSFQSTGADETMRGVSLNVQRSLRSRLSFAFGATWRESEFAFDNSNGTFVSFYPSITYELGRHTTARIQYEFTHNEGGGGSGLGGGGGLGGGFGGGLGGGALGGSVTNRDYDENAISANLIFHL